MSEREDMQKVMKYDAERIVDEVIQERVDKAIYQLIGKRVKEATESLYDYVDNVVADIKTPNSPRGEVRYFGGSLIHNRQDSSSIDFLQSGTGAIPTNLQARGRNIFFVTDFYANGSSGSAVDPTGVVDSTTGLQNAINAAYGNILIWPSGNYLISSALSIAKPLIIIAAGGSQNSVNYGARIFTNTATINLVNLTATAGGGNEVMGGSIQGLFLDGNSKASIGLNITGSSTSKWAFHKLEVINCTHLGTYASGNHSLHFYNCNWALNGITSDLATDGGVQLDGANAAHFWGCNSEANKGSGVLVSAGYENGWHGGVIEGNDYHGIIFSGTAQHFVVENTDFETNNQAAASTIYDVDISATTNAYITVRDCRFTGTATTDYINNNGPQNYIINCRGITSNKILWNTGAISGLFVGDVAAAIDAGSSLGNTSINQTSRVVNTVPNGMGVTTPSVPATTVAQANTTNVTVAVYITAIGTTTAWSLIDAGGRTQAFTTSLAVGFLCILPPAWQIKFTYTGAPSWKWAEVA